MVRGQRVARAALLFLVLVGCRQSPIRLPALNLTARVPRTRATVLVVKTNLLPERKAFVHLVIIADGKARIGNEVDQWRLFDLQNGTVTFVDDIAKTYRTETLAVLLRQKRERLRQPLPEFVSAAEFVSTDHVRTFSTFSATLHLIRLGGYQRSLWISTTLGIPDPLFPLIVASDPLTTPYSPAMANVFEAMIQLRGFPVLDRSDVTSGGQEWVIEKKLERVEQRMVPASWLQLPSAYQDLTPRPPQSRSRRRVLPRRLREVVPDFRQQRGSM